MGTTGKTMKQMVMGIGVTTTQGGGTTYPIVTPPPKP